MLETFPMVNEYRVTPTIIQSRQRMNSVFVEIVKSPYPTVVTVWKAQ